MRDWSYLRARFRQLAIGANGLQRSSIGITSDSFVSGVITMAPGITKPGLSERSQRQLQLAIIVGQRIGDFEIVAERLFHSSARFDQVVDACDPEREVVRLWFFKLKTFVGTAATNGYVEFVPRDRKAEVVRLSPGIAKGIKVDPFRAQFILECGSIANEFTGVRMKAFDGAIDCLPGETEIGAGDATDGEVVLSCENFVGPGADNFENIVVVVYREHLAIERSPRVT